MKTGNKIFHSAALVNTEALKLSLCMSHQIMSIREKSQKHRRPETTLQEKRGNSYGEWRTVFKQAKLIALANNTNIKYFQHLAKNILTLVTVKIISTLLCSSWH